MTDTLILDEDGLYDPSHFNDRLVLGMKGVMSEAELHVLQARLRGGILSKAERGELRLPLPVGLVYNGQPICQTIPGASIDEAIGELLVEAVTPMALEVALTVQQELQSRCDETDRLRRQQVERSRYEVELAKRRYMRVDPDNRLVADALEADWNAKLGALTEAQEDYERQRVADQRVLDEEQRAQIMALATDFPRLWRDARTPQRERKRMVRLLLEDVTLIRGQQITLHVRFKGGTARTLTLPLPRTSWELRQTPAEIVAQIDRLLDDHPDAQVAAILNERGLRSGWGRTFRSRIVSRLRREHGLKSRYDRLREAGMLTLEETAGRLGVARRTVRTWQRNGLLRAHAANDKNVCLFEPPGENSPIKRQGRRRSRRRRFRDFAPGRTEEVQYAT